MSKIETLAELRAKLVGFLVRGHKKVKIGYLLGVLSEEEEPQKLSDEERKIRVEQTLFQPVYAFARSALQSSVLINGGAVVACFPLLEKLLDKGCNILGFTNTLSFFVIGVLAAAIATGFSYLSQYRYSDASENQKRKGHFWRHLAIMLVIASYVLFAYGAYNAWQTLTAMKPPEITQKMSTCKPCIWHAPHTAEHSPWRNTN